MPQVKTKYSIGDLTQRAAVTLRAILTAPDNDFLVARVDYVNSLILMLAIVAHEFEERNKLLEGLLQRATQYVEGTTRHLTKQPYGLMDATSTRSLYNLFEDVVVWTQQGQWSTDPESYNADDGDFVDALVSGELYGPGDDPEGGQKNPNALVLWREIRKALDLPVHPPADVKEET